MKSRAILLIFVVVLFTSSVLAGFDRSKEKALALTSERSLPAVSNVSISLCVKSSNVTVSGWNKNEVLVRTAQTARIEFRRDNATSTSAPATNLQVLILDKMQQQGIDENCQALSDVELNVPRGAIVHVQTRDGNISIAGVATAYVGTQNGDVNIERISKAMEVCNVGGSVSVKDSSGRVTINSIGGAVEASNLRPTNSADAFEVISVSGEIALEELEFTQMNARTVSGNMHLIGPLTRGGHYGFKTMSGNITLTLPSGSSFRISAKISKDTDITSDFPLTMLATAISSSSARTATSQAKANAASSPMSIAEANAEPEIKVVTPAGPVITVQPKATAYTLRRVEAVYGTGDASINVASFSGVLRLEKQ
jgi:DUF4097 and DUF4098 domain-containing protein YvlB